MSKMRLNPALERLTPFSYCGTGYPVRLDANESCVPLSTEIRGELAAAVENLNLNCYPDDCAVALREGMEESGLTRLQADERLLGLDILAAPRHMKHGRQLSTHLHLNFTYLCFADERETLHPCEREVKGAMWIECRNIRSHVREQHMIPVYERLCERALSRYKKA